VNECRWEEAVHFDFHHRRQRTVASRLRQVEDFGDISGRAHRGTGRTRKLFRNIDLKAGAGRGSRTPKSRSSADFECDAPPLQLPAPQQFVRLALDAAARLVQFRVVLCSPVAHTLIPQVDAWTRISVACSLLTKLRIRRHWESALFSELDSTTHLPSWSIT
jgi:hypothetical protein